MHTHLSFSLSLSLSLLCPSTLLIPTTPGVWMHLLGTSRATQDSLARRPDACAMFHWCAAAAPNTQVSQPLGLRTSSHTICRCWLLHAQEAHATSDPKMAHELLAQHLVLPCRLDHMQAIRANIRGPRHRVLAAPTAHMHASERSSVVCVPQTSHSRACASIDACALSTHHTVSMPSRVPVSCAHAFLHRIGH